MFIKKINPKSFEKTSSNFLKNRIEALLQAKGIVHIALPGGSTPMPTLKLLANEKLDWARVCFYQTDERIISIDNKENNYSSLNAVFFSHIKSLSFPMYTGEHSPEESCESYLKELEKLETHNNIPRFDLILLGMGEDGHIASLFPNAALLAEPNKWVAVDQEKRNGFSRMTLCFPVLNNALETVLLISGSNKIKLIEDKEARKKLPIEILINQNQNLTVLCSKE
jgi:6-phosphogluconolactonase